MQLQRLQVISSTDTESGENVDRLHHQNELRNIFNQQDEDEKGQAFYGKKLKKILKTYEKKKLSSQERRIIEGMKSKSMQTKLHKKELKMSLKKKILAPAPIRPKNRITSDFAEDLR